MAKFCKMLNFIKILSSPTQIGVSTTLPFAQIQLQKY